jgi:hypothetical protein
VLVAEDGLVPGQHLLVGIVRHYTFTELAAALNAVAASDVFGIPDANSSPRRRAQNFRSNCS